VEGEGLVMLCCLNWRYVGNLPEPQKTQENLKKFVKIVVDDVRIRGQLLKLVSPDCECKRAEEAVVSSSIVPLLLIISVCDDNFIKRNIDLDAFLGHYLF